MGSGGRNPGLTASPRSAVEAGVTQVGLLPRAEEELRKLSDVADAVVAAESHGVRGRINQLRRDHHGALSEYRKAHELDPENAEFIAGELNALISLGRFKQAEALLDRSDVDDDLRLWYFGGKLAEKRHMLGHAVNAYYTLTGRLDHPYSRKALARQAAIFTMLGRIDEALMMYGLLNRVHPYDSETLHGYLPLLITQRRHGEAVKLLLDVTRLVPLQALAFHTLGDVYADAGLQPLADAFWAQAELIERRGGSHPKAA